MFVVKDCHCYVSIRSPRVRECAACQNSFCTRLWSTPAASGGSVLHQSLTCSVHRSILRRPTSWRANNREDLVRHWRESLHVAPASFTSSRGFPTLRYLEYIPYISRNGIPFMISRTIPWVLNGERGLDNRDSFPKVSRSKDIPYGNLR